MPDAAVQAVDGGTSTHFSLRQMADLSGRPRSLVKRIADQLGLTWELGPNGQRLHSREDFSAILAALAAIPTRVSTTQQYRAIHAPYLSAPGVRR